jgi:predicted amidohydrolase YtcJ
VTGLTIRNVEVAGRPGVDVRIEDSRVAAIGPKLGSAGLELDGRGGALIPGLTDHHIHLFALAAQADSVALDAVTSAGAFARRIVAGLAARPPGAWLRVTGYHEAMAGQLDRTVLDAVAPRHRLRVQHQTGSLWILNSLALETVLRASDPPEIERDPAGRATGRIWRGDALLRDRIGTQPPPLAPVGRQLAAFGITAVTDASVTTEAAAADGLAAAVRSGDLPQRLTLMSGGPLVAPADAAFAVGPVKVLLDDHDLPDVDAFAGRIAGARAQGRNVAVHCVTAGELAVTLAAFETAGAQSGDRIEHGGVIPPAAIVQLRRLGLTVVTQPAFIFERGDRYAAEVDPAEQADLYRCASLITAGIPVAASSDAPYASPDPWAGMAAAVARRTRAGRKLGSTEALGPRDALGLYLDEPASPGQGGRAISVGVAADLCLLRASLRDVLHAPSADFVAATIRRGDLVYAGG